MSKLTHAILIEGGSPEGRMTKALELLKEHFKDDSEAAGKIDTGTFEDLLFLEPEEGKDIKVDDIEGLIGLFKQKPFASTGKACIIPCGERMNEHAQNKMLKLLEEPAGDDVMIILTDNAQSLLPTVRSRLMRIWLGYAEPERIAPTEDLRNLTAALVYGKGTLAEANSILSRYEGSREEASAFVNSFQLLLRSFSVGRFDAALIGDSDRKEWVAESSGKIKQKHADRMQSGVMTAEKTLRDIERGDRIRYALRRMALSMRAGC